ncbi:predicted protein, partial [Nematostella vectensis]
MSLELQPRSLTWVVIETTAYVTLDIVIFVGNLLICIVVYRNPRMRSITNMLVVALSTTDLLTACITLPMAAGTSALGRWVYGSLGCQLYGFCSKFLVYVSIYTISLIALNRYLRICRPKVYRKHFTVRKCFIFLAFIWVFPALVRLLPSVLGYAQFTFSSQTAGCSMSFYNMRAQSPYTLFATLVFIALPMLLIIFCYTAVSLRVRKHRRNVTSSLNVRNQRSELRLSVEEVKITRTLFTLVFAFLICWLPVSVALLIVRAIVGSVPIIAARVLNCLVALSSACTPFVYGALNRSFRREFVKILS